MCSLDSVWQLLHVEVADVWFAGCAVSCCALQAQLPPDVQQQLLMLQAVAAAFD